MDSFTVNDLTLLSPLYGLKIVAAQPFADNEILNVNIIDNPDIFDWLKAGDFLLTTGYIFKDDEKLQIEFIRRLSRLHCAGIGIKVKRFFDSVPEIMIKEADKLGFPIVEIPYRYTLSDISNHINNQLAGHDERLFIRTADIESILTDCLINGGSIFDLTRRISEILKNPIIVTDRRWKLVSWYGYSENAKRILTSSLSFSQGKSVFPEEFITSMPKSIDKINGSVPRVLTLNKKDYNCRVQPILAGSTNHGYIIIPEIISDLKTQEHIGLSISVPILALEFLRIQQEEELRVRIRGNFFDDLIDSNITSEDAIINLARINGIEPFKPYVCIVIDVKEDKNAKMNDSERMEFKKSELARNIYQIAYGMNRSVISVRRSSLIVILLRVKASELSGIKTSALLGDFVKEIYKSAVSTIPGKRIAIGISELSKDIMHMKTAFNQALDALNSLALGKNDELYAFYCDKRLYYFLKNSVSKEKRDSFSLSVLSPLIKYDEENKTDLIATLECYFRCSENINRAASMMFMHRNSFSYRLAKIKSILNSELNDYDELLELKIALVIKCLKDN